MLEKLDETTTENKPLISNKLKRIHLFICCSAFCVYGCCHSLLGPTMPFLIKLWQTDRKVISEIISFKYLIFSLSTFIAKYTFKYGPNRQIQFGISAIIFSLLHGLIPWSTNIVHYLIISFLQGICSTYFESVPSLNVLELFEENSCTLIQLMHFSLALGTIIGPTTIALFFKKYEQVNYSNYSRKFDSFKYTSKDFFVYNLIPQINQQSLFRSFKKRDDVSNSVQLILKKNAFDNIIYPYMFASSVLFFIGVCVLIFEFSKPYVSQRSKTNSNFTNLTTSKSNLPKFYFYLVITLGSFLLTNTNSIDVNNSMFMSSFLILRKNDYKLSLDKIFELILYMNSLYTLGRFATLIITIYTKKIHYLLYFNLFLISFGFFLINFIVENSIIMLTISILIIGLGLSSTYPLLISFVEQRICITNNIQLILLFSTIFPLIFEPILIGFCIDNWPSFLPLFCFKISLLVLILLIFLHFTDSFKNLFINEFEISSIKEKTEDISKDKKFDIELDFNKTTLFTYKNKSTRFSTIKNKIELENSSSSSPGSDESLEIINLKKKKKTKKKKFNKLLISAQSMAPMPPLT